jgi:TRAP-type C4-dicarboxylate transport system permease small subunit
MRYYFVLIEKLSRWMRIISGILLTLMMLLTVVDVTLRYSGMPFMGAYDLVGIMGAAVIALSFPITSLNDGHVRVDFLVEQLPLSLARTVNATTKVLGIALFVLLAYGLTMKGRELYAAREASLTLHVPLAPICFVVGAGCLIAAFVLSLVLVQGILRRGSNE